ncbi:MAG: glycoside hydrolase family 3 C-terminal domain-containing protein [Clostridia bacterium]|nr:glycoside hydrolase family 3 C-terminal domain-containing protein [Clostridia bacterium]
MKHADLIKQMTLEEKASFCSGLDYWHTPGLERLGVPVVMWTDGPHGIRKRAEKMDKDQATSLKGVPAICYPTAATTACSWDPDLIYEMGVLLGEECLKEQVSVLLGPGTNIKRSPLCGRNFEYFSEDPYLAGEISAAFVNGVQSKGVGTSLKHFAGNNQETRRMTCDTVVDERALREIYLTSFEKTVKQAQPWTIMNAYNRLNGTYCAENKWLLTDVLRDEWGFQGMIVTDWGAENDRVAGLLAGQELEMPTSNGLGNKQIVEAVKGGRIPEEFLDKMVDNVLDVIMKSKDVLGDYTYDAVAHHQKAREIASQCMVLLKNEENILPLKKDANIAVIGEMAKNPRYQGAGSSIVNAIKVDCAYDSIVEKGAKVTYAAGYSTAKKNKIPDEKFIADAVEAAKGKDAVLLFIGLTEEFESEGFDRRHIGIPPLHIKLVEAVSAVNKNVVVVLAGGAVIEMPWADKVKGILNSILGGEATGSAAADILFGDVNPSGKLAETYPVELSDTPCYNYFPGNTATVEYRESVFVGYRYYDSAEKGVRFPFGYGLSYTTFEYSDIKLSAESIKDTDEVTVSFKVKNTGNVDGAEVAQIYVKDNESTIFRPKQELKGFKKVFLKAGEEKEVSITLGKRAFAYYNVNIHDWHVETGAFTICVGASSRDIKLSAELNVESTVEAIVPDYRETAPAYYSADIKNIPAEQFVSVLGRELPPSEIKAYPNLTLVNTIEDSAAGKNGAKIVGLIKKLVGEESMAAGIALQLPIKNLISMSFGIFNPKMAAQLLDILNDKKPLVRGIVVMVVKAIPAVIKGIPNLKKI